MRRSRNSSKIGAAQVAEQGDQRPDLLGHLLGVVERLVDQLEAGSDLMGDLQRLRGRGRRRRLLLADAALEGEEPAPPALRVTGLALDAQFHDLAPQ